MKQKSPNTNARILALIVVVASVIVGVAYSSTLASTHVNSNDISVTAPACSTTFPDGFSAGSATHVYLGINSTALVCVKYYYFNSTSSISFDPNAKISILRWQNVPNSNATRIVPVNSLFSLTAESASIGSDSQITVGGSQLLNEGSAVSYAISATSSTPSGVYFVDINAGLYPENVYCQGIFELVVGAAQYVPGGLPCFPIPHDGISVHKLDSNNFITGYLSEELIGISNSTLAS